MDLKNYFKLSTKYLTEDELLNINELHDQGFTKYANNAISLFKYIQVDRKGKCFHLDLDKAPKNMSVLELLKDIKKCYENMFELNIYFDNQTLRSLYFINDFYYVILYNEGKEQIYHTVRLDLFADFIINNVKQVKIN